MKTINTIHLRGYVGQDPQIKYTSSSTCVARFSIATNRDGYIGDDGQKILEDQTDWHSVICFNDLAELVERDVHRGDLVDVEGSLTYHQMRMGEVQRVLPRIDAAEIRVMESAEQRLADRVALSDGTETDTPSAHPPVHNTYGRYLDTLSQDRSADHLPF